MKWQAIWERLKGYLGRLTGISTPVFGVSWNPPANERDAAHRVLTFLEDKRVLYRATEYEYPQACGNSVESIREKLTEEIGLLPPSSPLSNYLRGIRAECRRFLNITQQQSLLVVAIKGYAYPAQHWFFIDALKGLRDSVGLHLATIAVSYGLDIESDLQSILPPAQPPEEDA